MKYCRKEDDVFCHTVMTKTQTKKRQRQIQRQNKFHEEWINVYRFKFLVLMYIGCRGHDNIHDDMIMYVIHT